MQYHICLNMCVCVHKHGKLTYIQNNKVSEENILQRFHSINESCEISCWTPRSGVPYVVCNAAAARNIVTQKFLRTCPTPKANNKSETRIFVLTSYRASRNNCFAGEKRIKLDLATKYMIAVVFGNESGQIISIPIDSYMEIGGSS